jgi:hypothetical protein
VSWALALALLLGAAAPSVPRASAPAAPPADGPPPAADSRPADAPPSAEASPDAAAERESLPRESVRLRDPFEARPPRSARWRLTDPFEATPREREQHGELFDPFREGAARHPGL